MEKGSRLRVNALPNVLYLQSHSVQEIEFPKCSADYLVSKEENQKWKMLIGFESARCHIFWTYIFHLGTKKSKRTKTIAIEFQKRMTPHEFAQSRITTQIEPTAHGRHVFCKGKSRAGNTPALHLPVQSLRPCSRLIWPLSGPRNKRSKIGNKEIGKDKMNISVSAFRPL